MGSMAGSTSTGSPSTDGAPSVELRASVLDAAISLGFRNSVMAKWMFDPDASNAADRSNPGLMSPTATSVSSHSASTSDESSMSPYIGRFRSSPHSPDNAKPSLGVITEQNGDYDTSMGMERLPPFPGVGYKPSALANKTSFDDGPKDKKSSRKQKGQGYESDGGYLSESGQGKKSSAKSRWRRKDNANSDNTNGNATDFEESDGGYLSEAVAMGKASKGRGKSKKEKARGKREDALQRTTDALPTIPVDSNGDPEAFLARINASLTHSSSDSPSSPVNTSALLPSREHPLPDGYTTDSGPNSRGRSKSASSKKSKKVRDNAAEDEMRAPAKKSFFRMVSRSVSRDRDKDKSRRARDSPTPPPVPPMPTILPIAERFARSNAGTPLGFAPGADARLSNENAPLAPMNGLSVPSPATPALSVSSSFVDITPPGLRTASPTDFRPSIESVGASSLAPPASHNLRHAGSRMSLNYPQMKSAPNGKALGELGSARSFELPRERLTDGSGWSATTPGNVDMKTATILTHDSASQQPKADEVKDKDREKKIRKGLGIFAATGALFAHKAGPPAPASAPAISAPNAHLFNGIQRADTKDIVDALNAKRAGSMGSSGSPGSENVARAASPPTSYPSSSSLSTPAAGNSSESDSYFHYSAHPYSSSSLSSTPAESPGSSKLANGNGTAAASGTIAARRAAAPSRGLPIPLVINVPGDESKQGKGSVTPTQSRAGTPTIEVQREDDNHNDQSVFVPASPRASVLAYYDVPPPSPPPTGPLPPPPSSQAPSNRPNQLSSLSPNRAFAHASRSPSPLRSRSPPSVALTVPRGLSSRSPSPGLQAQANVRRGKESPFPTRPVLPPQNSRDLVERVERAKEIYANSAAQPGDELNDGEWGEDDNWRDAAEDAYVNADAGAYEFDGRDETRMSGYIRAARARGEKRVYFVSPPQSADTEGAFPDLQDGERDNGRVRIEMVPLVEEDEEQMHLESSEIADADAEVGVEEALLRPRPRPIEDEDRRSIASASVYSRYSMLDEEASAQTREGFLKRVHEWEKEDYPAMPQIPDEFKQPKTEVPASGWRSQLKPTNSRFKA